jgi:UDP-glucuronate decarboxylase
VKILVAGGAGFLGSHLCTRLLQEGHQVYCLDNFHTGSRQNISSLLESDLFILLERDVKELLELEIDLIFNLACPASPVHYQSDPVSTVTTNVIGSINLLNLARSNQARIFQASTSEVYGDPEVSPQSEEYWGSVNPIGVRSCYDEGKRCAETLFFDYHRQYGVDIRVARIFNTYGPRMAVDDGRVVSNFIVQALRGEHLTVYGDGDQTRSFCYVDDLISGILCLMFTDKDITGPINLGNPHEMTMVELAELVIGLTKSSKSRVIHQGLPLDDPRQRKPDISLARTELDWVPKVSLEDGLERTIAYFRELLLS